MIANPRTRSITLALALLGVSVSALQAQGGFEPRPFKCAGTCARIANAFIRADVGPNGTWVLGTTGGDPDTATDDDKNLLYGFLPGGASSVGSGFSSIRVLGPKGSWDAVPIDPAPQTVGPDRIDTVWDWSGAESPYPVRVTETLRLRQNPFSGRPDLVDLTYTLENRDQVPLDIGVRAFLDIKLGVNDGAPYFIPGVGTISTERDFTGDQVPPYWLAFESPIYDPDQLRSIGLLRDAELEAPSRLVIAAWRNMFRSEWDYAIDASQAITKDSAVALYFDPQTIPPGGSVRHSTAYGISGSRGGRAFVSAKILARCGETIDVALFVSNFDSFPSTGGQARIMPPSGWTLAAGETERKPMGDIAPGSTGSVAWRLQVPAGLSGSFTIAARADFDGGRSFESDTRLDVDCLPTATPSPTRTPSSPPPATPTQEPSTALACALILRRVPPAAISAALANPEAVFGWLQPANPGLPPGPSNPPRRWLSLRDIGKAFHPLFNPLIFKVGCP